MKIRKLSWKQVFALSLSLIVFTSLISYIAFSNPSLSYTTVIQEGSMATESSYIIFKDGSTYYARNGETGVVTSSTNASYIINTALVNANGHARVYLKEAIYELDTSITITINGSKLEGSGSSREQIYFSQCPSPLERITTGTVLKVTASGIDAIKIVGKLFGISIKHLAIDFSQASTGCGINCGTTNDIGLSEFHFKDIFINDHDANSYALRMENGVLGRVDGLTSFGGPLLELVSEDTAQGAFNSGNIVFTQISGWITKDITNHAVYIHRGSGLGWSNLYLFNRLFVIMDSGVNMSAYSGLRAEYLHHSEFNMLNIECTYSIASDVVHLAEAHDVTFVSPYVMYSANAGWMSFTDCDTIRVFGGTVDVAVADRNATNRWFGTCIHSVDGTNVANLLECWIWDGNKWEPTNVRSSSSGTSPITVTHGLTSAPTWIHITPAGSAGSFFYDNVTSTEFKIYFDGGGTGFFIWSCGIYQAP